LRFFIQDNERCSIRNVARIYEGLPISKENKKRFRTSRSNLNKFLDSELPVKVDDETITLRGILEMFIYGDLAHANRKKRELLDQWMSYPLADVVVSNQFVFILEALMGFIAWVRSLNQEVIKELTGKK